MVRLIVAENQDSVPLDVTKIWIDFEKTMMTSPEAISLDQWCETNSPQHRHLVVHLCQPIQAVDPIVTDQQIAMGNHAFRLM